MHPEVRRVIPVAMRRWRKNVLGPKTWSEVGEFRRLSQSEHYDAIIDTQGLIKSAVVARTAKGRLHGFDAASAREPLATRLYDVRHHVARGEHAVVRNRLLAASVLGYRLEPAVNYGIPAMATRGVERKACVFLHGTSRSDKLWPEDAWVTLGRKLNSMGISVILPWGSDAELRRSESMAAAIPGSSVPGRMTIVQMADLMRSSAFIVGVDTGLTHLAAALGCRVAALFVASDPRKTGVHGAVLARNLGRIGAAPLPQEVMDALMELKAF